MENLAEIMQEIDARLEQKNQRREQSLSLSRKVVQHASQAIRAIHRREQASAEKLLGDMTAIVVEMNRISRDEPDIYMAGYVQDAQKEHAEAHLTFALVHNQALPTPGVLEVEEAAYLNGLGEAASELRRYILDLLRHNKMREAQRLLEAMEEVYSQLMTVDFPHAITGNLRRTSDMLRGVLERTRGDVTMVMKQRQLRRDLRRLEKRLR